MRHIHCRDSVSISFILFLLVLAFYYGEKQRGQSVQEMSTFSEELPCTPSNK